MKKRRRKSERRRERARERERASEREGESEQERARVRARERERESEGVIAPANRSFLLSDELPCRDGREATRLGRDTVQVLSSHHR